MKHFSATAIFVRVGHGCNLQAFYGLLARQRHEWEVETGALWVSRLISIATNKQSPKVNAVKVFLVKALGPNICINAWFPRANRQTAKQTNKQTGRQKDRRTYKQADRHRSRARKQHTARELLTGLTISVSLCRRICCNWPPELFYFRFRARTLVA